MCLTSCRSGRGRPSELETGDSQRRRTPIPCGTRPGAHYHGRRTPHSDGLRAHRPDGESGPRLDLTPAYARSRTNTSEGRAQRSVSASRERSWRHIVPPRSDGRLPSRASAGSRRRATRVRRRPSEDSGGDPILARAYLLGARWEMRYGAHPARCLVHPLRTEGHSFDATENRSQGRMTGREGTRTDLARRPLDAPKRFRSSRVGEMWEKCPIWLDFAFPPATL